MAETEQFRVYEVADHIGAGVRVQLEYQPAPNLALATSGVPVLRALAVHNETGAALTAIGVEGRFAFGQREEATFSAGVAGPSAPGSVVQIPLDTVAAQATVTAFQDSLESASGTVSLRVSTTTDPAEGGGSQPIVVDLELPVRVMPGNEFLNWPELHAALAVFVRPNSRSLTPILRAASDLLLDQTRSGALEGYQSGPRRAGRIAGALYEALRARQLTYINPPASFEFTGQKVRTLDQVLADRFGTCIDLAVLYAAALEAVGLYPVMFVTAGHAFAGYYSDGQLAESPVVHDANLIANLVESGAVVPVELTGVNPGSKVPFRAAVGLARDYFRNSFDLVRSMVDVTRCRLAGVLTLPSLAFERPAGISAGETVAGPDDRPFVVRSSLKDLTLADETERVSGTLDLSDDAPPRVKNWKRDLLDLSLRNPLLNLPRSGKALDLLVPGGLLAKIDDAVHAGKKLTVLPADGVDELARQRGIRVASELDPATVTRYFEIDRSLFGAVDHQAFVRKLRTLQRDAQTLEQETGSNYLYLAMGSLVHPKPSGDEARAPLFLLPVQLHGNPLLGYRFEVDPGEVAIPNLCLVEWLRTTKGVRFAVLENPPTDDSGIAMTTVLRELRGELVEKKVPFRVDETATIAILRFSTFQIWRDLDQNWAQLTASPIVDHLVHRPGESFVDPRGDEPVELDEASRRFAVPADGSQLGAVVRACAGQSFVLEGPPGTGKSQTITNLIAEVMRDGKTVLFVAEKQAALEVVKRRLNAIGLGRFTLQLHGDKQSMGSIRAQLKAALQVSPTTPPANWLSDSARLSGVISELEQYPERVHGRNALGLSLWEAYEQQTALGDGAAAEVPAAVLRGGGTSLDELVRVVGEFTVAAGRAGLRRGDAWSLVGPGFGQAGADAPVSASTLVSLVERLHAALDACEALPADVAALLVDLHPARLLPHAAYLLDRAAQGLVAEPDLAATTVPGWFERLAALRARLGRFGTDHAELLRQARPELFTAGDLGELQARSRTLDQARLFHEWRRKKLRARLGELTNPNSAAKLPGEALSPFLDQAVTASGEAAELRRDLAATTGLRLPTDWAPWMPDALLEFDQAASTSASAAVLHGAIGGDGLRSLLDLPDASRRAVIEVDAAWQSWRAALSASELTLDSWALPPDGGPGDWVAAWRRSGPRWLSDLQATGTLRPQRAAAIAVSTTRLAEKGLANFALELQSGRIAAADAVSALLRGAARSTVAERIAANRLADFDRGRQDGLADAYTGLSADGRAFAAQELAKTLIDRRPFDPQHLRGEVAELRRQTERKRGGLTFRELAGRYRQALQAIAPCFLMSPGSVAHYLPGDFCFDVVVFDEASQIRVPRAIGALGRGRSAVIAGDSKQMPPTRIMEVTASGVNLAEDDGPDGDDATEEVVVEDLESILDEAVESGLPREWLTWHYRSQDERLIAFSNLAYYEGRLVTLPSPRLAEGPRRGESVTGLEWRRVEGTFDRGRSRTNETEARQIVTAISERLANPETRSDSIGVVTFNVQQRDLILDLLEDSTDLQIKAALHRPPGEAIFVKNLENVQGDERDVILFSLAFSRDPVTGRVPLQFGPLLLAGGERRLNVAITRARKRVVLFSSFDPADLDLSRSGARGLADLKAYLEFAAGGPLRSARKADEDETDVAAGPANGLPAATRSTLVTALRSELERRGYVVADMLGLSRFKVDLAVRRPEDESGWRVAVIADGPGWAALPTVADRDGSPALLETIMRWPTVERVWLPAWLRNPGDVLAALVERIEGTGPFDPAATDRAPTAEAEDEEVEALTEENRAAIEPADAAPATSGEAAVPGPGSGSTPPAPPAEQEPSTANPDGTAFTIFNPAATNPTGDVTTLDDPRRAVAAVQRCADEILRVEGPTSADRLARLIGARFGLSRVVEKRRTDILDIVKRTFATTESANFIWPSGVEPSTWVDIARSSPEGARVFQEISLHELVNGMVILLRQAFSMTTDELAGETVRAFGYMRVTPSVRNRLDLAVAQGVTGGRLALDGDRVRLPPA